MEDLNSLNKRTHKVSLSNRRTCNLTGVVDVLSFDLNEIILETDQGMLMIKGSELHVNRLTLEKGEVDILGTGGNGRQGRITAVEAFQVGGYERDDCG